MLREHRQRTVIRHRKGFLGYLGTYGFVGWNIFHFFRYMNARELQTELVTKQTNEWSAIGTQLGSDYVLNGMLQTWIVGAIIFALLALIFRGHKEVIYK